MNVLLLLLIFAGNFQYDLRLARVKYNGGGDWYNDPDVLPNLAKYINKHTNLKVEPREYVVSFDNPDLFKFPFLYLTGHGNIKLSDDEIKNLRKYLENGGFLYVDDDYGLDKYFRREIKKVFPDKKLVELPFSNPIYHVFYNFEKGLPKIHEHYKGPPHGYGIIIKGRVALFYTYNTNISDGWTPRHNDPPVKREEAFKMGTNIVLYSLIY